MSLSTGTRTSSPSRVASASGTNDYEVPNSRVLTVTHCGSPVRSLKVDVADRADLAAVGVHEVSTLHTVNVILARHR